MIGDLTSAPEPCIIKLFSQRPRRSCEVGAGNGQGDRRRFTAVVDILDGIENTISGPAMVFTVDPVVAARAGFSPQEVEVDASAILQGEPAADAGGGGRPRLHDSCPVPRVDARHA